MLKRLAADGKTVFLSSHNLPEVEEVCTRIAIIIKGRIVACDEIAVLRARYGRPTIRVELGADFEPAKKEVLLRQIATLPYVIKYTESSGVLKVELRDQSEAVKFNQYLVSLKVPVMQLSISSLSLEEIYNILIREEGVGNDHKNS
jgi:ABC-2 type transport system ATP-binding protein